MASDKGHNDMPPRYEFVLNPYPTERISRCPFCEGKTGQRKLPLLIHIDPLYLVALNYTCRYCADCDLLIAHKHEIEHLLTVMFQQRNPAAIGNEYLILGTIEKSDWREGMKGTLSLQKGAERAHRFKEVYQELRMLQQGWFPEGVTPPIWEPPLSKEWVRVKRRR